MNPEEESVLFTTGAADAPPQPDATVDGYVEDPANPGWAEVSFSDGRKQTLPVEQVKELPQTAPAAPAPVYGGDAAGFGAPPPAVDPAAQNPLAQQWDAAGRDPLVQATEAGMAAPGYQAPASALPGAGQNGAGMPGGVSTLPGAQVDPMAQIVSPGGVGGEMVPSSQSASESTTTSTTVDDPNVMEARLASAADADAQARRQRDLDAYGAKTAGYDVGLEGVEREAAEARRAQRQAELEVGEHTKFIKAMEATPIDEDGFWSESPGRKAAAWIALGLSGFLQGATRGQNPALAQMTQALNHAQDRWVQNQQRNRESVLSRREKLMGNAQNARDSVTMQLRGLMSKKIDLESGRAGVPVPPGLETYRAESAMKVAEAQNAIGSRISQQATRQSTEEARASAPTGPVRRGDLVLQHLGVDRKAHADAMDPKGLNLGGVVGGASRLQVVEQALAKVAAKYGNSLPSQETVSWSSLGLAPQAARLGMDRGRDEVSVKQLLEEAKLAYKQTVNIKSIDSENEGKNFNLIMDSGEGQSTLDAIRARASIANENALSVASGVTRDPQAYLEFVRGQQQNNPGVTKEREGFASRPTGYRVPGAEQGAVEQTTGGAAGGGPAPSAPLAGPPGAQPPTAPGLATSTTGSLRGSYRRLRESKLPVPR